MKKLFRFLLILVVLAIFVGVWYYRNAPQSKQDYLKNLTPQQALEFLEEMDVQLPESYQAMDKDTLGEEAKRVIAELMKSSMYLGIFSSTEIPGYQFGEAVKNAIDDYLKTE